jgi:hypothetical protein
MKLVSTTNQRTGPSIHGLFLHTVNASGFRYGIYTSAIPPQEKTQDKEKPEIKLP